MPQSHPTTGPVRFLSPVRFLAHKAEWSARRNFVLILYSWSHQATGPIWLNRTPRVPHVMPVWASYRPHAGIFHVFHILRGPCGTRRGAVWRPYGHVRELTQPELAKIPHGRRIWPHGARTGPLWSPHGLFMGCLWSLNLYRARNLIMHALKLYGPRMGRQNSCNAARGPRVDIRFLFKTARMGPGIVMWLRLL